jgi:hypothetical protein
MVFDKLGGLMSVKRFFIDFTAMAILVLKIIIFDSMK